MNKDKPGKPFLIILGAVAILAALSFVPWSEITGGRIKNFNLLSDLFNDNIKIDATEAIDPELTAALKNDSDNGQKSDAQRISDETPQIPVEPAPVIDNVAHDGTIIIEDYTVGKQGLIHLKNVLGNRLARVAVIGDSYIEGDILTMDIRQALQDKFGGNGVGYVPVSSELTGFRTTVKQTCSGWTHKEIRKEKDATMKILSGEYFIAAPGAKTTFKGNSKIGHLDTWTLTRVLAYAPNGGTVSISTDSGNISAPLDSTSTVQLVTLPGLTSTASIEASTGVAVLGAYLDGGSGIAVDNMSLRGNSGITHRFLSPQRAAQMRQYVDYDLIVMEYGINALSSQQSDYSGYKNLMKQVISRLRECYPHADILMMGIGDRGQKIGTDIMSLPTSQNMVNAQRDAARETGVLFWDTRTAMGGEGAVINWREKGYINPDYIHLNQKGGKALGSLFTTALLKEIGK